MKVRNCNWKWMFQCPKRWEGLSPTSDPKIRSCDSCLEKVYLCADDEVAEHASQRHCVAVKPREGSSGALLGVVLKVPHVDDEYD